MKITKRKIQASTDYRQFVEMTLEELKEWDTDLYYDFFHDIRNDVDKVYISKKYPELRTVGVKDTEGRYYVYEPDVIDNPGWYEVNFDELFKYLF